MTELALRFKELTAHPALTTSSALGSFGELLKGFRLPFLKEKPADIFNMTGDANALQEALRRYSYREGDELNHQ